MAARTGVVCVVLAVSVLVPVPAVLAWEQEVGRVIAWGYNSHGQCNVPVPNSGFVGVAAGYYHSLGLKADGSIVAWGAGQAAQTGWPHYGQCMPPSPNSGFVAVAAGELHSLGLKADGSIVAWGGNSSGQCDVPSPNSGFVAIAAGGRHSLGLEADGSIVAWGAGQAGQTGWPHYGQCMLPSPNSGFVAVAAGGYHSLGLKADGSIVAWGSNSDGQCMLPSPNSGFVAVGAGGLHSLGVKADGSVVAWGRNDYGQCNVPAPNSGFVAIAASHAHSLGLKGDGSIVAWGYNVSGQCDVPGPNNGFVASAAGGSYSLAIRGNCATSSATWQNAPLPTQGGQFRIEYDAIPNAANIDGLTALSAWAGSSWLDFAVLVGFETAGFIVARNGGEYQADVSVPYAPGMSYHFRLEVDVPAHRYSVYVTPAGGAEIQLAIDYAFLTEQSGVTCLDNWALQASTGSHQVCNVRLACAGSGITNIATGVSYCTIQEAIDAAVDGDQIVLQPLTYTGDGNRDIDFGGKAITVRSTDPEDPSVVAATVVDCQGDYLEQHRGFDFHSGEGADSVLAGLTITGGFFDVYPQIVHGAGILCEGSNPTLSRCVIAGNMGGFTAGGGIACIAASPYISGCVIRGNLAEYQGGGIYSEDSADLHIVRCTIESNTAVLGGAAGIRCIGGAVRIEECAITGNEGITGSAGGGIVCSDAAVELVNSHVTDNWTSPSGRIDGIGSIGGTLMIRGCTISDNGGYDGSGGLYCWNTSVTVADSNIEDNWHGGVYSDNSSLIMDRCTVAGNGSDSGVWVEDGTLAIRNCLVVGNGGNRVWPTSCGGIYSTSPDTTIAGCTIYGNSAYWAGGGVYCSDPGAVIKNSIIWGNIVGRPEVEPDPQRHQIDGPAVPAYCCIQDWTDAGERNIALDPLLVDPANGDYHLQTGSPCINTGDPGYVPGADETDIDGQPRIYAGRVDIGADEYSIPGDVDLDGDVDLFDVITVIGAFGSVPGDAAWDAACDFNRNGIVDIFDVIDAVTNFGAGT